MAVNRVNARGRRIRRRLMSRRCGYYLQAIIFYFKKYIITTCCGKHIYSGLSFLCVYCSYWRQKTQSSLWTLHCLKVFVLVRPLVVRYKRFALITLLKSLIHFEHLLASLQPALHHDSGLAFWFLEQFVFPPPFLYTCAVCGETSAFDWKSSSVQRV